jgi:hypothetical protein
MAVAILATSAFTNASWAQDLSIPDDLVARIKTYSAENPREDGTDAPDWRYKLPAGVTTEQVTWYSDDAACYAKMFYPPNFDPSGSYPGVVLGHGTNAITIAMEKYGAVFAEYGIVAMAIDYRTYGFSEGTVILTEPDTTTDDQRITEKEARIEIKRTRLLTKRQFEDYRNAISYLQGEPGVDPERIGVWGSSLSGGTAVAVANNDARVKAVVAQVPAPSTPRPIGPPRPSRTPEDDILRARTGQGGERMRGFSIRTHTDLENEGYVNVGNLPKTTAILFLPAENDELIRLSFVTGAAETYKARGNPVACVTIPYITHFQAYGGPPFEATSTLAARWFAHYLQADS